ncbi:MAG: hypothetical protein ACJATP_003515 [Candidatus Azotimanducaceae bacterium]|jgi:hypothetical protein
MSHIKAHLYTSHWEMTAIGNVLTPDLTIGNDELLVVEGFDFGGE